MRSLKLKAAAAGELEVITQDETFKTLFALIGQKKMSQAEGEVHALHTFRGFTGCTLGVSAQRSTSGNCFRAAVEATFVNNLAEKVKFLFSDCPSRIYKVASETFKSLVALGEDALHLAIRLECCWGEKKTKPSVRVRQLHRKFNVPTLSIEPFWNPGGLKVTTVVWPENPAKDTRSADEWTKYCSCPFNGVTGHTEYATELAKIVVSYGKYMGSKNSKGVTAEEILRSGAAWHHFQGLQNGSRLHAHLGSKGRRLGSGTTRNEQLHMELKAWGRNVYQTHIGQLQCRIRIFEMAKLLTHSSAAYYPTLTQTRQRRLLSTIAGQIRNNPFFPMGTFQLQEATERKDLCRKDLNTAIDRGNIFTGMMRKRERKQNRAMWEKGERNESTKKENTTDIFKRKRVR